MFVFYISIFSSYRGVVSLIISHWPFLKDPVVVLPLAVFQGKWKSTGGCNPLFGTSEDVYLFALPTVMEEQIFRPFVSNSLYSKVRVRSPTTHVEGFRLCS